VVHVVGSDDDRSGAEAVLAGAEERLAEQAAEFEDVEEALVEAADGQDVVVIAAEKEGILKRLVFGSIPESVGDRIEETSIMCKRNVGAPSRLKRLLT
jgi:nucleotide-binding universal stress UspA family protein